ncbi:MAG: hypothetical protein AB7R89_19435 [Dehalococcoidia bacterium]
MTTPNVSHMVMVEQQDRIAEEIVTFAREEEPHPSPGPSPR